MLYRPVFSCWEKRLLIALVIYLYGKNEVLYFEGNVTSYWAPQLWKQTGARFLPLAVHSVWYSLWDQPRYFVVVTDGQKERTLFFGKKYHGNIWTWFLMGLLNLCLNTDYTQWCSENSHQREWGKHCEWRLDWGETGNPSWFFL